MNKEPRHGQGYLRVKQSGGMRVVILALLTKEV